jgi:hypothetical protein
MSSVARFPTMFIPALLRCESSVSCSTFVSGRGTTAIASFKLERASIRRLTATCPGGHPA